MKAENTGKDTGFESSTRIAATRLIQYGRRFAMGDPIGIVKMSVDRQWEIAQSDNEDCVATESSCLYTTKYVDLSIHSVGTHL